MKTMNGSDDYRNGVSKEFESVQHCQNATHLIHPSLRKDRENGIEHDKNFLPSRNNVVDFLTVDNLISATTA